MAPAHLLGVFVAASHNEPVFSSVFFFPFMVEALSTCC